VRPYDQLSVIIVIRDEVVHADERRLSCTASAALANLYHTTPALANHYHTTPALANHYNTTPALANHYHTS